MARRCKGFEKVCTTWIPDTKKSAYCYQCEERSDRAKLFAQDKVVPRTQHRRPPPEWNPVPDLGRIQPLVFEGLDKTVIIEAVRIAYGLPEDAFLRRPTRPEIQKPAYVAIFLLIEDLQMKACDAAKEFHYLSYVSAINAYKSVSDSVGVDPRFQEAVRLIRTMYGKHD